MTDSNNNKPFRLAWMTDPHLNFVSDAEIKLAAQSILKLDPDALVITGDIAEGQNIDVYLAFLDIQMKNKCPIFFVLGNHDYYNSSIADVRARMSELFTYDEINKQAFDARLGFLSTSGVIPLTSDTALVGHDGWYDGGYANWFTSKVWLNDYICIRELGDNSCPVNQLRYDKIRELSRESAEYVKEHVTKAFADFDHVYVATHVPPFRENAVYNGKISDADWMPHFSSKFMGDCLLELAQNNPDKRLTVLCGHSHGSADVQVLPNLRVITGDARYHNPKINQVFEF